MTSTRREIHKMMKKANRRIEWLRSSKNNIFSQQSEREIELLYDKMSRLNNVSRGNVRIGALQEEDEEMFYNILKNFVDNPITTYKGQRVDIVDKGFETFKKNHHVRISRDDYLSLIKIWESDTFQKFKENFGTYGNVIDEMARHPKDYNKAIRLLSSANRMADKQRSKYTWGGNLNARAFISAWKDL